MSGGDGGARVVPDGVAIRRRRRARGWSRREFVHEISEASFRASGLRKSISVNQLKGIEENNEVIAYEVLCRLAAGLDTDPVSLSVP